jgi:hypothetical protein
MSATMETVNSISTVSETTGSQSVIQGNEECDICGEFYNRSKRTMVECMYCCFQACRTCCETYILDRPVPTCMKPDCKKEWSREFLSRNFSQVFMCKTYKSHREDVLFDLQKAMMPATQVLVEQEIRRENTKIRLQEIDAIIADLKKQKEDLIAQDTFYQHHPQEAKVSSFIRACPAESCRGYLNTNWECGICEKVTCKECLEIKNAGHECNPETVETAKLLKADTKPCPTCRTLIFKISGCDQMWCTQCKTAFSWKTGAIETQIHNPHYYEWRRQNGGLERAIGDVECGREINNQLHDNFLFHIRMNHKALISMSAATGRIRYHPAIIRMSDMIRNLIHIRRVEFGAFQTNFEYKNEQLRIAYLRQRIDEEKFKHSIQANDKAQHKNREILQILQLMHTAGSDIIFRIVEQVRTMVTADVDLAILDEFDELITYCNRKLFDISSAYKCSQYAFNEVLDFHNVKTAKKDKVTP